MSAPYKVPLYQPAPGAVWLHALYGHVPQHQQDFIYRPVSPFESFRPQHYGDLQPLIRALQPAAGREFAFLIGNLSVGDTRHRPGHGGLALAIGVRVQDAVDHAGRELPTFVHAAFFVDQQVDEPFLQRAAESLVRHFHEEGHGPAWYRRYYSLGEPANDEAQAAYLRALEKPAPVLQPPPSQGLQARWKLNERRQRCNRFLIVRPPDTPFRQLAPVMARLGALLYYAKVRWVSISDSQEEVRQRIYEINPNELTVRFVDQPPASADERVRCCALQEVPERDWELAELLGLEERLPAATPGRLGQEAGHEGDTPSFVGPVLGWTPGSQRETLGTPEAAGADPAPLAGRVAEDEAMGTGADLQRESAPEQEPQQGEARTVMLGGPPQGADEEKTVIQQDRASPQAQPELSPPPPESTVDRPVPVVARAPSRHNDPTEIFVQTAHGLEPRRSSPAAPGPSAESPSAESSPSLRSHDLRATPSEVGSRRRRTSSWPVVMLLGLGAAVGTGVTYVVVRRPPEPERPADVATPARPVAQAAPRAPQDPRQGPQQIVVAQNMGPSPRAGGHVPGNFKEDTAAGPGVLHPMSPQVQIGLQGTEPRPGGSGGRAPAGAGQQRGAARDAGKAPQRTRTPVEDAWTKMAWVRLCVKAVERNKELVSDRQRQEICDRLESLSFEYEKAAGSQGAAPDPYGINHLEVLKDGLFRLGKTAKPFCDDLHETQPKAPVQPAQWSECDHLRARGPGPGPAPAGGPTGDLPDGAAPQTRQLRQVKWGER